MLQREPGTLGPVPARGGAWEWERTSLNETTKPKNRKQRVKRYWWCPETWLIHGRLLPYRRPWVWVLILSSRRALARYKQTKAKKKEGVGFSPNFGSDTNTAFISLFLRHPKLCILAAPECQRELTGTFKGFRDTAPPLGHRADLWPEVVLSLNIKLLTIVASMQSFMFGGCCALKIPCEREMKVAMSNQIPSARYCGYLRK